MDTILVTGGLGYIGSHTCLELVTKGLNVCIIDSLINSSENTFLRLNEILRKSNKKLKGNIYFRQGDLLNKEFLEEIFREFKNKKNAFSSVIHFAGLKSVEESVTNPLKYWGTNLNSALNLLEIMNNFECYSIVFSSSATIYKPLDKGKLIESNFKDPINPYGKTKLAIEKILEDIFFCNSEKWRIANLRYFNPVGAHNSGLIGEELNNKPSNLLPVILKVSRGEYKELSIFGNDWPTKDGTCIRDYIHIMDLAEAHYATLDFLSRGNPQMISLNIGTGIGTSVLEMVNKFIEVNDVSVPYSFKARRKGDTPLLIADNSLALNLLNWIPKRNIEEMCIDAWRWAQLNLY